MEPTLKRGDYVLIKYTRTVKVGDIVVLRIKGKDMIKRVSKVNQSEIWVIGDNTDQSTDSRTYGWIDTDKLIGKVVCSFKS